MAMQLLVYIVQTYPLFVTRILVTYRLDFHQI
jgi:hypothetical protein